MTGLNLPTLAKQLTLSLALFAGAASLAGPAQASSWGAPKFTISQSDDRFRADTLTVISSDGNRISKRSIAGGRHIDKQGVYLNPVATIDRSTGTVVSLSFDFFNIVERMSGVPELNDIGRPLRVSFLTGEGLPIELEVERGQQRFGDTHCTRTVVTCFSSQIEGGMVPITIDQYRRVMAATALAIKIEGTERSHVYEQPDVSPTFIQNLTSFHATYLANAE